MLPTSLQKTIETFSDLPGVGNKSAERLVFGLLKNESGLDQRLGKLLLELKEKIGECPQCHHYCETDTPSSPPAKEDLGYFSDDNHLDTQLCPICQNLTRDQNTLCIIEAPSDLIALERTHEYKGQYHVLHGLISPLRRVQAQDLRIDSLLHRLKQNPEINEIIFALPSNVEADVTTMYITDKISDIFSGTITRLARGIPTSGDFEYLDVGTISRALSERRSF